MGGQQWVEQHMQGFPMTGRLMGPGVHPTHREIPSPASRQDLLKESRARFVKRSKEPMKYDKTLWRDSRGRAAKVWLDGPSPFDYEGKIRHKEGLLEVNPAF